VLRVRARAGGPLEAIDLSLICGVDTSFDPGGRLGALTARLAAGRARRSDDDSPAPRRHLGLRLSGGARVVLVNSTGLRDGDLGDLARALGALLRVPVLDQADAHR
jgi:hypothetical protein